MRVYADNAATTPISEHAKAEMIKYMDAEYENASSLHSFGQSAAAALAEARERIGKCIGADAGEIYFTSGGSEADNQAIISAAHFGAKKNKKHMKKPLIKKLICIGDLLKPRKKL